MAARISVLDCVLDNGGVDPFHYMQYIHQNRERDQLIINSLNLMTHGNLPDDDCNAFPAAPKPQKRAPHVVYASKDSASGILVIIPPEESLWYKMYVSNYYILKCPWLQEKFHARFHLPYQNFRELVEWVSADPLFEC
jgi:hypothetical protein